MEKLQNLINSCLAKVVDMPSSQQSEYAIWTLKRVQEELNSMSSKKYYVRICKDRELDELDIENMQLFSFEDLKDEFYAIDYIDDKLFESSDLTITDLQEIASANDEFIAELEVVKNL